MSTRPVQYLFPQTSRALTPNAPGYDPSKDVKSWIDPNPGQGPTVSYSVLDPNYNVISLTLTIQEASTLNLPGHPDYPAYAPVKSTAVFASSNIQIPFGLSSEADAQTLAKTLGLDASAVFDMMATLFPGNVITYDPTDPRRAWGLKLANGALEVVATLLAQQYANGVGSPGEWVKDASGNVSWKSELPSDTPTTPILPVPIVPLAPGETIVVGPFGPQIVTADPVPVPTGGGSGPVDLVADLRAAILETVAWVKRVGG